MNDNAEKTMDDTVDAVVETLQSAKAAGIVRVTLLMRFGQFELAGHLYAACPDTARPGAVLLIGQAIHGASDYGTVLHALAPHAEEIKT